MRPCSAALETFLDNSLNREVYIVDLFTMGLLTGEVFRWTAGVGAVTVPAAGFPAGSINVGADRAFSVGPRFGRSKVTTKVGIEPTEVLVDIFASVNDLVGDFPFAEAIRIGLFDGAVVEIDRLFVPPGGAGIFLDTSLGCLLWFYGRIAETTAGRSKIELRVKGLTDLLAIQQMPRRIYGANCTHVFGDLMCGYDRVLGKNALGASTGIGQVNITAGGGSDGGHIVAGFSPSPSSIYNGGTLIGVTGANTGAYRTISTVSGGSVFVVKTFLSNVVPGDTFHALPGCDHTTATCNGPFNNLLRNGSFAYIPPPEMGV